MSEAKIMKNVEDMLRAAKTLKELEVTTELTGLSLNAEFAWLCFGDKEQLFAETFSKCRCSGCR